LYNSRSDSKEAEKNGRPWKTTGRFDTFEGADVLRQGLLLTCSEDIDVKVKKMAKEFVVKTREKLVPASSSEEKREKRKSKKSKKNRKNKNEEIQDSSRQPKGRHRTHKHG